MSDELFIKNQAAMKVGRLVSGRQIVNMVLASLRTNQGMDVTYDITALKDIEWQGDTPEQISQYRNTIHYVIANMRGNPEDTTKAELVLKTMRKSKVMAPYILEYDNEYDKTQVHSLEKLDRYMERYILRKFQEANDDIKTQGLAKVAKHGIHAVLPGTTRDPKEEYDKGKGRGRRVKAKARKVRRPDRTAKGRVKVVATTTTTIITITTTTSHPTIRINSARSGPTDVVRRGISATTPTTTK